MKAYSLDLRDRVIATYKEGRLNKTEISILFKVSYDTVLDWIKRYIATGDYSSKQGSGCGRAMRFNDKNAILKFIEENPDANGIDIRDDLQSASRCTVSKADQLYSFDSTLSALNSCTRGLKNGASIFESFKYSLYAQTRERQSQRDAAFAAQLREEQRRNNLLYPRLPMICHNMGIFLECD